MEEVKEKKEPLKMPSGTISVTIGPNSYDIKIPNNGQLIDIETRKAKLTDGSHSQMLFGGGAAQQAYLLTEVVSVFSILIPQLLKDLNTTSLLELNPIQTKEMVKVYTDIIHPWLTQIREVANEDVEIK